VLIATPIAMAFTHTWQELLIVRIFFGYGIGLKGATVAIYSAEVAPTVIRGALVMGWQLWTTVGIVLGFGKLIDDHCSPSAANAIVRNSGAITWRLQIGSSFIPAVPLAVLCFFGPESPRWYMRKGRMAEAFVSMGKLRNHPILASRDLYYAWVQWEAELKVSQMIRRGFLILYRFTAINLCGSDLASFSLSLVTGGPLWLQQRFTSDRTYVGSTVRHSQR
jgi:MFS family permease